MIEATFFILDINDPNFDVWATELLLIWGTGPVIENRLGLSTIGSWFGKRANGLPTIGLSASSSSWYNWGEGEENETGRLRNGELEAEVGLDEIIDDK